MLKRIGFDDEIAEIDEICCWLFSEWCDRRSIIALAYLLQAWPISIYGDKNLEKLLDSIKCLYYFHIDLFSPSAAGKVEKLFDAIERVIVVRGREDGSLHRSANEASLYILSEKNEDVDGTGR
ncbi:hypothetical protein [Burkholderia ambifaria]|uniref:hypothetical protein n=1 Tax=Burkholderia ambifaria TaxID=152480 RepID=UPI000A4749B5|nr:hypothetical protein [Burkholderia ambifaria]